MYMQRHAEDLALVPTGTEPYLIHLDTYLYHPHLRDARFGAEGLCSHFGMRRLDAVALGTRSRPQYVGTYRLDAQDGRGEPRSLPLTVFGSPAGWLIDYPAATYLGILSSKERGGGEEFLLGLEQFVRYADAQITEVWDAGQRQFSPPAVAPAPLPARRRAAPPTPPLFFVWPYLLAAGLALFAPSSAIGLIGIAASVVALWLLL